MITWNVLFLLIFDTASCHISARLGCHFSAILPHVWIWNMLSNRVVSETAAYLLFWACLPCCHLINIDVCNASRLKQCSCKILRETFKSIYSQTPWKLGSFEKTLFQNLAREIRCCKWKSCQWMQWSMAGLASFENTNSIVRESLRGFPFSVWHDVSDNLGAMKER